MLALKGPVAGKFTPPFFPHGRSVFIVTAACWAPDQAFGYAGRTFISPFASELIGFSLAITLMVHIPYNEKVPVVEYGCTNSRSHLFAGVWRKRRSLLNEKGKSRWRASSWKQSWRELPECSGNGCGQDRPGVKRMIMGYKFRWFTMTP